MHYFHYLSSYPRIHEENDHDMCSKNVLYTESSYLYLRALDTVHLE